MAGHREISLMCRLCLLKDNEQVNIPIFEDHNNDNELLMKISALLPIKISKEDKLPKKICDGCSDKLNLLYEFRNTSLLSEQTLLCWLRDDNLAEASVKEEIQIKDEPFHLKLTQKSSTDEEAEKEEEEVEEPPVQQPRRSAAIKALSSFSRCNNNNVKFENENEEIAYEKSGLGGDIAGEPLMVRDECLEDGDVKMEIQMSDIELIDPNEGIFIKEVKVSNDADSSGPDDIENGTEIVELIHVKKGSDVIKKYQCYICNATFKTKTVIRNHLTTHSNIRPFECDICDAKFKRKSQLKPHKLRHSNIRPFKCDSCKARFKYKSNLKSHSFLHLDEKNFRCNTCDARFGVERYLKNHLKKHLDIYPFECDICEAKYKWKRSLYNHRMTHFDNYPFECDTCKAKFKRKDNFKRHISRHSN